MKRLAMLAVGLLAILANPVMAQNVRSAAQVGLPAPKFTARTVNAGAVALAKMIKPAGAVVAFADPRSQLGADLIAFMQQSYAKVRQSGAGAVVLTLGGGQEETTARLVKANGLTVPVAHDAGQAVAKQYGVTGSATSMVIGPDGLVYGRFDATEQARDAGPKAIEALTKLQTELEEARKKADKGSGKGDDKKGTAAADGRVPAKGPSDSEMRQRIETGWRLIQSGYVAAALEDARTLAMQRGDDWQATLWLAYCQEAGRLYPEAAVTYRKVLLLRPGHVYSLKAIARIDPEGRYRTPSDLPKPTPAASTSERGGATTSQGAATVGQ